VILRALAIWLLLVALAIANGTFRSTVLIPRTGEPIGHVLSTLMLSVLIFGATWLTIGWVRPESQGQAVLVGLVWVALTVLFEFGAGHYLFRQSWERLLADYNLAKGRIWILVLIVTAKAPLIAAKARGVVS